MFFAYCLVYFFPGEKSRIFGQYMLFINVLEAGILAIVQKEYIVGILLILLSPFSPRFYLLQDGTFESKKGSIFQKYELISNKLYYRSYLILLGTLSLFGKYFIDDRKVFKKEKFGSIIIDFFTYRDIL